MSDPLCMVCTVYDDATSTCTTSAWQQCPTFIPDIPSFEDAQVIGWTFLAGWVSVAALKYFLKPRREQDHE